MKMLRGKFLMRKSKLENGTQVLTMTGVCYPNNFSVDDIADNDEMWVADVIISGGLRFTGPLNNVHSNASPEDFLEGEGQSPKCWKNKTQL